MFVQHECDDIMAHAIFVWQTLLSQQSQKGQETEEEDREPGVVEEPGGYWGSDSEGGTSQEVEETEQEISKIPPRHWGGGESRGELQGLSSTRDALLLLRLRKLALYTCSGLLHIPKEPFSMPWLQVCVLDSNRFLCIEGGGMNWDMVRGLYSTS